MLMDQSQHSGEETGLQSVSLMFFPAELQGGEAPGESEPGNSSITQELEAFWKQSPQILP